MVIHGFSGKEAYREKTVSSLGLPAYDTFVARSKDREFQILMNGDHAKALAGLTGE